MIALALAYALYEFSAKVRSENATYDALISVLTHIRKKISLGMQILSGMLSDINVSSEQESVIVEMLVKDRIGQKNLRSTSVKSEVFRIKGEDRERFIEYFEDFGSNEWERECKRLDSALEYFERRRTEVRELSERKIKSYTVLFITALSGALILFV